MLKPKRGGARAATSALAIALTATAVIAPATPASAQPQTGVFYQLVSRHSGKAIDIEGSSTSDGARVIQWSRGSGQNQQFQFVSSGDGYYRIVARHSGKALDVYGWNASNGAEIRQWADANGTNQQWRPVDRGGGYYSFVNRFSGKALDLWGWSTADGAPLSQYDNTGGVNQQWQLVTAGGTAWQSCDQWANWSSGGWTLYNNIWGSGAGPQCIWANTPTNWGVNANHPNTGGIKSYPNITRYYGRQVSQMGTATSSFNVTVPTSNVAFTSTYDIWSSDNAHEIMVWMNRYGPVGAIGSYQTTVTVGGHTWDFYRGSHSGIQVYSFLRNGDTVSGTIDIRAISQWLVNTGRMPNVTIGNVQFGFEITSASGGQNFAVNSYSVNLN
ncbi:RICIN domain-containing protein [Catelliglobosispora koreensis]|uniref:RICIN domain-containing protein n=1 Tax=Catelliglobosispora koreensis TaxID=129052 RepID=UPI0003A3EA38|nr:RICIN domain-containing protein [Catelliglobosispora koreensis]